MILIQSCQTFQVEYNFICDIVQISPQFRRLEKTNILFVRTIFLKWS